MTKCGLLALVWSVGAAISLGGQAPTADELVKSGLAKARAEHKNVLIDFHASWCPWCKQLDALYEDPQFAEKFRKSYVIVPITVIERPSLKAKTNDGWDALMFKYRKHKDQDIPYVVILGPTGKPLADSFERYGSALPNNAGFPQTPEEIDAYIKQISETGKGFQFADLAKLRTFFVNVRGKSHGGH
ncbi:MAG: thioredoxin family protein [Fimbriimonas sp.]|nr:thioredoxin family protein [Fimbriimonas sp.]